MLGPSAATSSHRGDCWTGLPRWWKLRELSASVLLYTPKQVVLSVALFDLWASGDIGYLAALSVLMIVVAVAALGALRWLGAGGPGMEREGM